MGALCSCLGGDSPKESKEPNSQAPGAVVNTSEASSRAGLAAIRRWLSLSLSLTLSSVLQSSAFFFMKSSLVSLRSALHLKKPPKKTLFSLTVNPNPKPSSALVFRLCDQIWGPYMTIFRANRYIDLLMWFVAWHTERNNLQIHQLEKLHIKLQRQRLALLQTEEGNLHSKYVYLTHPYTL